MNTFAFNPSDKIQKQYKYILKQIKKSEDFWDTAKITIIIFSLLFFVFMYLYFISLASTRGYFLRQAMQRRNTASFQEEILKTQVLRIQQENRQKITDRSIQQLNRNTSRSKTIFID